MGCAKDEVKENVDKKDRVMEGKEYRQKILDKDKVESSVAETYEPPKKKS